MVRKIEILLVLVTIVLLTLFSASFADPNAGNKNYDRQSAFYGRDILIETSEKTEINTNGKSQESGSQITEKTDTQLQMYFWGIPDFSHQ